MTAPVKRGTFRRSCRTCGWAAVRATAGRADQAKAKHSCARQMRLTAQAARHEARMAAVDRTPKPCAHKRVTHEHGTYACYRLDDCRCRPCAQAVSDYNSNKTRQEAYGRWNAFVDAAPVLEHVRALQAAGMGRRRIVAVSGVSDTVVQRLIGGKQRRMRPDVAQRILAVTWAPADHALIDGRPTRLRVQALVALGWSQAVLARRLEVQRSNFRLARCEVVTAKAARAVAALYDELSMTLPPETAHRDKISVSRSRKYAADRGWVPPLALDDDRLDDPAYRPGSFELESGQNRIDFAVVDRILSGQAHSANNAERREVVARWRAAGRPIVDLERLTGWKPERYYTPGEQVAS